MEPPLGMVSRQFEVVFAQAIAVQDQRPVPSIARTACCDFNAVEVEGIQHSASESSRSSDSIHLRNRSSVLTVPTVSQALRKRAPSLSCFVGRRGFRRRCSLSPPLKCAAGHHHLRALSGICASAFGGLSRLFRSHADTDDMAPGCLLFQSRIRLAVVSSIRLTGLRSRKLSLNSSATWACTVARIQSTPRPSAARAAALSPAASNA